jgi:pimeloyl-ACP methyl ester carboxylesterase
MPESVAFYSEGVKVVGDWYAAGRDRRPVVILCHGFTGVKGMVLPDVGQRLCAAGYHVLAFDYRFFGDSGGEPRGRIIPLEQVRDIRAAITYVQTRPEVDPQRVALWGTSFGGANVVYTAAHDARVQCVVANVGVMRGARWLRSLRGPEQWYQLLDRVAQERQHRVLTGEFTEVAPFEVMPVDSQTVPFIRQYWAQIPNLPRCITFDTVEAVLEYDPQGVIQRIAPRPLLMIAVERDQIVPNEETVEAFAEAGEPKKLVWLPRHLGHWGAYVGEGFERVMSETLAWYQQWLPIEAGHS